MHISKIYIQDNFVPDYTVDQFRRKVFGMEITIQEKEDVGAAISEAEKHIAEYIKANTTATFEGIQERIIEKEKPLSTRDAVINGIQTCTEVKVLESYKLLCGVDTELKHIYETKLKELTNE